MSEVAGRLAPIVGANCMLRPSGGPGLLMPGVPGTHPARVVVLGGGVAGTNAVAVSVGLGADVTVLDTNVQRLRELDALYAGRVRTIASNSFEIERAAVEADLLIGSVLVPGAKAPKLVSNALVSRMKPGSVLVDIAVDQGGCFEDTRPTTHADPTFTVHGSLFYCVANMPGAVPNTSTYALTNVTLPYARAIADSGWQRSAARGCGARPRAQRARRHRRQPAGGRGARPRRPGSWPPPSPDRPLAGTRSAASPHGRAVADQPALPRTCAERRRELSRAGEGAMVGERAPRAARSATRVGRGRAAPTRRARHPDPRARRSERRRR